MNIYALVKRTFDTEERIAVSNGKIVEDGAEFIIGKYAGARSVLRASPLHAWNDWRGVIVIPARVPIHN